MAVAYTPTGTYSNITRLELEQLRRADFTAGGKALTVGDSALAPEGVVGKGNVQAEPFFTGPPVNLDDVYPITPPTQPGRGLITQTGIGLFSEFAQWCGPLDVYDAFAAAYANSATTWTDPSPAFSFIIQGVLPGDILLIKETSGVGLNVNANAVATVAAPVLASVLNLTNIYRPNGNTNVLDTTGLATAKFSYVIIRPKAIQLFAVPGSGPVGEEQTFLMVAPNAETPITGVIQQLSPALDTINAQRVQNIVRPNAGLNASVDRADFVFDLGSPRLALKASLETLGYRVVLYPSDATGTAPDYTSPITSLNPIIDPAIPAGDQRMTIDFKAGVVRFSCAPKVGGDIKPAGGTLGTNPTTGRLTMWAVYWQVDLSLTMGNSRGVYSPRSTNQKSFTSGVIRYDNSDSSVDQTQIKGFRVGSTAQASDAYLKALGTPEANLSTPTSFPFAFPWKRASVEIGGVDSTNLNTNLRGLRYFSYRQRSDQWRFNSRTSAFYQVFGYTDSEMFVADKTEFTVSDASSPANAAANMNPRSVFGGSDRGIRSHLNAGLMTDLHRQLAATPYGTVHLKKGRFYIQNAIHVPPGSTIEGEGSATKLIYRNYDSTIPASGRANALFKVGPNTGWGVYDASAFPDESAPFYKTGILPTEIHFPNTLRIEGMDTLWNPVRRCWAVVIADATTNSIWFNEMREDGTQVFPGTGINVKDTVRPLFVQGSPKSHHHSGGHYPRLAYHEAANEYSIVWVEEQPLPNAGPQVAYRVFEVQSDATAVGWKVDYTYGASTLVPGTQDYQDHPSIAVDNFTASTPYKTLIVMWDYAVTGENPAGDSRVTWTTIQSGVIGVQAASAYAPTSVVSSTDVATDELGNFMAVWSHRAHALLRSVNGTIVLAANSYLQDLSFPNWNTVGVVPGSKVHLLVSPVAGGFQQGLSGVVTSIGPPSQAFIKWEGGNDFLADSPVTWAISPPSQIHGMHKVGAVDILVSVVESGLLDGSYQLEMREPDLVRISRGAASWCVAFQGFYTHCFPSIPLVKNYENGYQPSPTSPGIVLADPQPYREHVSTCAVILRDDGKVVFPTSQTVFPVGTWTGRHITTGNLDVTDARTARDLEVSLKSLGTRTPITERPNFESGVRIPWNYAREVSLLNFSYRWKDTGVLTPIPDVSWTGQDWVIVSPSKNQLHSHTGNWNGSGIDTRIKDVLLYFGQDTPTANSFGFVLRNTLPPGASIWFPSVPGTIYAINAILDEHSIEFTGNPFGIGSGTNLEYVLIFPPYPDNAGAKNQGFRIGSDGRLITSTDFITWADQPSDLSNVPRETELMRRPQVRGGNYPAVVAGDNPGESADRLQAGTRHKANIGFRGVAPGRPKGISRRALLESPMSALAWGENLYGFVDRVVESDIEDSLVEFYRQTFGPYNVTLRNFSIEATPTTALTVQSKAHVYTRHFGPVASVLAFDTDGFRNVFVYPQARVFSPYHVLGLEQATFNIGVTYTNAKGQDPLYMDGPALGRSDLSKWPSDIAWETLTTGGFLARDNRRYIAPGVGPKVLWDGQRFVLFWIERANTKILGITDAAVGYLLCMSYMPGSEDAGVQTSELVNPYEALVVATAQLPMGSVHVSDGSGLSTSTYTTPAATQSNTVAVCEAAFSGKVYAVLWVAGMTPHLNTASRSRGSVIGVTLFNMDSAVPATVSGFTGQGTTGGGTTHVIDTFTEGASCQNPKILWDGNRFVIFYEQVSIVRVNAIPETSIESHVVYTVMSENGMAQPMSIKQIAAPGLLIGTPYPTTIAGSTGPHSAIGGVSHLGTAVSTGFFGVGTPNFGAAYTVLQTYGSIIGPAMASGIAVAGTTLNLLGDAASGDFIAKGVRPGDYLFIGSGLNIGNFVIVAVAVNTLTCDTSWIPGGVFVFEANVAYDVIRFQQPSIQPGDVLVVTGTNKLGFGFSLKSNGVYPVLNYDPRSRQLTVQGAFNAEGIDPYGRTVTTYGEIRSGGLSDYDNGALVESGRAGVNPRSYRIADPTGGSGGDFGETARLHAVAYNDVDDEFAVLSQYRGTGSIGGAMTVYTFKPNTRAAGAEVFLTNTAVDEYVSAGDIGWNGSHYLVVGACSTVAGLGKVQLQAQLLNSRLNEVAKAVLAPNVSDPPSTGFLFGNGPGQLPGPGYGPFPVPPYSFPKVAFEVFPFVSQMKVKWNPRLSRWLVAASVLWSEWVVPATTGNYSDFGIFGGSGQTIMAWAVRTITFAAKAQTWQPGMKAMIFDGTGKVTAVVTILDGADTGGVGTGYNQLTVDALASEVVVTPGVSKMVAVSREDVLMWTLGQDATGLIIEDADNVHVEDVVIGGGATDISESWPNMGRPIWQAAGQAWGNPLETSFALNSSITRQPQYNHRLMTPAGKVNLPTYTNVTSAGRHPYGRKAQPGAGYVRDNLRHPMKG